MNLKELARLLALSPTTVSRALNGYPEVSEATRARVTQAAEQHNYQPNTQARRLATGRSMAIGHVLPISTRHEIVNPVFADFIAGAGEVYAANGYDMVLTIVPDRDEARAYREIRSKGNVDGIIVHGPRAGDFRVGLLQDLRLPFVVHGRAAGTLAPHDWVDVNNRRAFERATALLLDLGHRRIALVNGIEEMDFAARRRTGYLEAHAARGIAADPVLMVAGEMTEAQGARALREMLALPSPPTAVLCSSLLSAMGARRAVEDAGLRMGRDVSIVAHDDELGYLRNGETEPIFTATRSSVRLHGKLCAELLLARIADPAAPPVHRLLEATLVIGRSTGPAPAALGSVAAGA